MFAPVHHQHYIALYGYMGLSLHRHRKCGQIGYVGIPSSRENTYGFSLCLPGLWVVAGPANTQTRQTLHGLQRESEWIARIAYILKMFALSFLKVVHFNFHLILLTQHYLN